jgi:hypothetical protein
MMRAFFTVTTFACLAGCAGGSRPSPEDRLPASAAPGTDLRGELLITGRVSAVSATPNGRVLLATLTGTLFTAPHLERDWTEVVDPAKPRGNGFMPSNRPFSGGVSGLAFANDSHGVAWGLMTSRGSSAGSDTVSVFTTADAGSTWTQRRLGRGFNLAAGDVRPTGEYWVAGYSMGANAMRDITTVVYHSTDFGVTWQAMTAPPGSSPTTDLVMDDDGTGVLGVLRNQLFVTRDTGRTWTAITTPFDQRTYQKAEYDQDWPRINAAKVARGQLLVVQDGRVFTASIDSVVWRELPSADYRLVTLDRATREWCVLNSAWQLRTGRELSQLSTPRTEGLRAPPVAVECRGGTLHAVDLNGRVYAASAARTVDALPLTSGTTRRPVVREQQRGVAHWGASDQQLYGTTDDGTTWFRYPFAASSVAGFAARSAHEVLVWDGHGANTIFDRRTGRSRVVPTLQGRDVVQVHDRDSVWLAFGGRQSDAAQRVEVAQTFFAGQFRGSANYGFVMISRDAGATWTEIDRWDEAGVAALYVSETADHMVAVSYLGAVRAIARRGDGFVGTTLLTATAANRKEVPYVGAVAALHFVSTDTGYIAGDIHHVGRKVFKTVDGGRQWSPAPAAEFPYRGLQWTPTGMIGWDARRLYRLDGATPTVIATVVADSTTQYLRSVAPPHDGSVAITLQAFADQRLSRVRVALR